jgi:hypothetical protein
MEYKVCHYCHTSLEVARILHKGAYGEYFCEDDDCVFEYASEFDIIHAEDEESEVF